MKMLENRMVVDSEWDSIGCTQEEQEKITNPGYTDISGTFVCEEDAFDYALERCLHGTEDDQKEFRDMLIEWFYSNWIKED